MNGWAYRLQEWLAFGHGRWHRLTCPFCRGMLRYIRDQQRSAEHTAVSDG